MFSVYILSITIFAAAVFMWRYMQRDIPGPLLARFTSYYRLWLLIEGKAPLKYASLHAQYGTVVRTGPNHVSISDSQLIPIIYDAKHKFLKGRFYDVFRPLYRGRPLDTVFTTSDPALNKSLKHVLVANLLNRPHLFVKEIEESVDLFIGQMAATPGEPIDLSNWAFFWAFDLTYALVFGGHVGYMATRSDVNRMVYSFKTIVRSAAMLGQIPQWCPSTLASDTFMTLCRSFSKFPDPTIQLLEEIEKKIRDHGLYPHVCGNSLLCRVLQDRSLDEYSQEYIEVVNVLFEAYLAAAGEVAVSVTSILYSLLSDRLVFRTLQSLIRSNDPLATSYLNAVIKESLRIHTSNSPPMERVVPAGGLELNQYFIPAGTVLGIPQYVVHRDPNVYGADAQDFRPERWLETDAIALKIMDQTFMTFGKGCRACVGRELAMLEMRIFLIEVLKVFDLDWAFENIRPRTINYWMMEYFDFYVHFKEHSS